MSNPFVRVAQNDDNVPLRQPLVSSDVFATSGTVLSGIGVASQPVRDTTTNVISQDAFIRQNHPLTCVNLVNTGLRVPSKDYITPTGPYVSPGGVFVDNNLSTTTVRAVLVRPLLPA